MYVLFTILGILMNPISMAAPLPGTLHTFHMNSGEVRNGHVIGNRDNWIRIQISVPEDIRISPQVVTVLLNQQSIRQAIPLDWHLWDSVTRSENDDSEDQEILEQKKDALEQGWNTMSCILGIPEARVGTLGNALAHTIMTIWRKTLDGQKMGLSTGEHDPDLLRAAHDIYAVIEEKSSRLQERITARSGKLAIKRLKKENQEALEEAKRWVTESSDTPLEAWDALGEGLLIDAEELIQEHPRWEQDRFVRPKIISLFNTCLNASLISFVCQPVERDWAARGLIRSARVYELWKNSQLAKQIATDLIEFYPQFQNQLKRSCPSLSFQNLANTSNKSHETL